MFLKTLTFHGQIRSFIVDALAANGWEVRIEQDSRIVRRSHYTDWHRVERAVDAMERETKELQAQGWRVTADIAGGRYPMNR
jgi:hypothetical protein